MREENKAQLKRLKDMGIDLEFSGDTSENELSTLLEQIDDQLAELTRLSGLMLDSEEPATLANMSALAIDVDVEVKDIIAILGEASEEDKDHFAEEGLDILFAQLSERGLAFSVTNTETNVAFIAHQLNVCLDKHGLQTIDQSLIDNIEQLSRASDDDRYEAVDNIWYEFCQVLDQRGLNLIQLTTYENADQVVDDELQLIALSEPVSHKWTNRGFGRYVLLAFSDLFLGD